MNIDLKSFFKKALPYLLILSGFVVLSYSYAPQVLRGKVVNQADISHWKGMSHEIVSHNEEHPEDPALWTNSMFGGMPATQISVDYRGDATSFLYDMLLWGKRPPSYILVSLIGAFLLFLAFGVNPYLSAVGAIAVSFCSYNMQIIQVGHNTKMVAIAFMPWVLAALVYAYRRKYLLGSILFGLALSFQIKANHPQITYYLAFMVAGYAIAELCGAIKNRMMPRWLKASAALLVAGLLGIGTNANKLIPTYEYAEYTMRGGSELSHDEENKTDGGLKLDYATAWSYGIEETLNMLIPNLNGGSSNGALSKESETYKVLKANYRNPDTIIENMPLYWGPQPFTAGPMYMGAISVFLFVLGLILIKGRYKWWIAGVSLLALLLGWGSHFMWFSEIFFKYAPLYNKFRTVSMILVILQITIPLLGILALNKILKESYEGGTAVSNDKKGLYAATAIVGGICLLFALFPSLAGDFSSPADSSIFGNNNALIRALMEDRASLVRKDAFTSLVFILLSAAVIWAVMKRMIKPMAAVAIVGGLILVNMWSVDRRYLNDSHFSKEREFNNQFAERAVDKYILQDKDPYYRVLDLTVNVFNDASVSYHHKTIGGYNPAKLQRYQDMIDFHIAPEINRMISDLQKGTLGYYPVLSMLNTKYIVVDGSSVPISYDKRSGNAWLVANSLSASTADEEMALLGEIDPAITAVVFDPELPSGSESAYGADGEIYLTEYSPNRLEYSAEISSDKALAIFSDIYYPAGWKAYIDGEESEILRADYILRALEIPAGKHDIVFEYSPGSFRTGRNISLVSSLSLILLLAGFIVSRVVTKVKDR